MGKKREREIHELFVVESSCSQSMCMYVHKNVFQSMEEALKEFVWDICRDFAIITSTLCALSSLSIFILSFSLFCSIFSLSPFFHPFPIPHVNVIS